jgi:membrane-associated phospholipid phosphatase
VSGSIGEPVLTDHRRAFWYALLLLGSLAFVLVGVGRHPPEVAPLTTIPALGRIDQHVYDWMQTIRMAVLSGPFRLLNVVGGGVVTIPIRIVASLILLVRRRWRAFAAFVLTWAGSEIALSVLKAYFHRGRPPHPLVATVGYSFPSGHAVAATATAVALVLAFFQPGSARRKWEWIAIGFSFVMAFSRVYLNAHWFFDVVSGVLLGSGIAIGSAALATEVAHAYLRRHAASPGPAD